MGIKITRKTFAKKTISRICHTDGLILYNIFGFGLWIFTGVNDDYDNDGFFDNGDYDDKE